MSSPDLSRTSEFNRNLLEFARAVARRKLGDAACQHRPLPPGLKVRYGGAFVTFWDGRTLRGCVGTFKPTTDLAGALPEVVHAALADPRFAAHPITATELPSLNIEISLLSELTPVSDAVRELVPGVHGIVVRLGDRSGCFLPAVASQRGWSAKEFLSNCCTMKAGLPGDAWRLPDATVHLFTSEVLSESEFV